jgi:hypothetical protein
MVIKQVNMDDFRSATMTHAPSYMRREFLRSSMEAQLKRQGIAEDEARSVVGQTVYLSEVFVRLLGHIWGEITDSARSAYAQSLSDVSGDH